MTDPRKIAEDIEAGGGATVEQRRTLARAYLALVSDLQHAVERCACRMASDSAAWRMEPAHRAAIERLRALGGGTP